MKKIYFVAVFLLLSTSVFGSEKIIIATGEWAPYTSEQLQGYGFFSEIVFAVFNDMGIYYDIVFYPWKRCEENVRHGKIFAAFPYRITNDRKKDFDFSDVVAVSRGVFFFLKSKLQKEVIWDNYSDLKGYRIGGTLGYWYEKVFKEAGLTTEYVINDEINFKKLKAGRVDMVASEELVGWEVIKKMFPSSIYNFDTVKKPLDISELHLMISKKYPGADELKRQFNFNLKLIKEKGIYSKILKKYNIKE